MPRRLLIALPVGLAALALAGPGLAARPVVPRLDLSTPSGSPFPSDRWTVVDRTQRTGLRVALPKPDCTARPTDCADVAVLDTLDGFNVQPRISIPFTGAIDPASVSSDDVFFVRLFGGDGAGPRRIGINEVVWDPATLTLHAESDRLLDQDATYALVVTKGIRDASGRPIGGVPLGRLARLVRGAPGLGRIAVASVFTTQSVTATMQQIGAQVAAATPAPARFDLGPGGARTVFPLADVTAIAFRRQVGTAPTFSTSFMPTPALLLVPGAIGRVAFGKYASPDYETVGGFIPPVGTRTGVPAVQSTEDVYFNLFLPSGPAPAGGWPVAVFGHGFTDNKNDSPLAVAAIMAAHGVATIAINVVGHGGGPLGTLVVSRVSGPPVTLPAGGRGVDQDGNGTIDSTEGVSATGPQAIVSNRDGLNQTVADLLQLVRVIQVGVDVDGDARSDLDPARISYFGQSFGGIYGTELVAAAPAIRAGVLNVPGGPIVDIARLSPAFRPLLELSLATRVPSLLNGGVDGFDENLPLRDQPPLVNTLPGADAIQQVIDRTEWVSQSSNPVAWAPHLRADPLSGQAGKAVIVQFAKGDETVPNPTASALIRAGGLEDRTTYFRNDLAHAADPTFPKNPHTFLTNIASGPGPALVAVAAQTQIARFLASGGTVFADPDGPAPLFETPIAGPLPEQLNFLP